ncbi:MAG: multiubiquitin domain-containing protein [Pseudobdellovibrionaceae bacterium]
MSKEQVLEIYVNGQKVKIIGHVIKGLDIKETALEQGLPIQLSFSLSKEADNGHVEISDEEVVHLHPNDRFTALSREVNISLNSHQVKFVSSRVTGLHIKETGIEQGVHLHVNDILLKQTAHGPIVIENDEKVLLHNGDIFETKVHEFTILVNERPVTVTIHQMTGLEIKNTAIAQHVSIQVDFVLSEELGDHKSRIVGDIDRVSIHRHSRFIAVAPDDNS